MRLSRIQQQVSMSSFLKHVASSYLPTESGSEELDTCVQLLKTKNFAAARDLVRSGKVPVRLKMCNMGPSLLQVSMRSDFGIALVVEDVVELLDAVKLRGELLNEADLEAACRSGQVALVEECLKRGAPMSPDALHVSVKYGGFRQQQGNVAKIARLLLSAKVAIDHLGSHGETALTTLCGAVGSREPGLIQWLLNQRADPNGADGVRGPLHALQRSPGITKGNLKLLIDHRADVNQRESIMGNSPLHLVLDPRNPYGKFDLALELRALGADCSLVNKDGLRPAHILLEKGDVERAAQLENRPMNQDELEVHAALKHPVAAMFKNSGIARVSWVLHCPPKRLGTSPTSTYEDLDLDLDAKLSSLLDGCSPKSVALKLPLTRYSELCETVEFPAPEEGFTIRSLLTEIYAYYQDCFDAGQIGKIQRHFGAGALGDTFGYIRNNIPDRNEDSDSQAPPGKRQAAQRISLRGDSVFFEGFSNCMYFEKKSRLFGAMMLGS
eukprot:TRINITY_DN65800_c0_g1_i1.p1 TRINITY_DN65800_c0_g1~~TRINITY_DN65800_c0_g1_i1.p1  ORF type:complete len:497 (-),score=77.60 TRINITY_DN65800_c0_g1_i1:329-1819(-)